MTLIINGKDYQFADAPILLPQLLTQLEIHYPVLVELNGTALLQSERDAQQIHDGDRIELFRMVAGG